MRKFLVISTLVLAACASGGNKEDGDAVGNRVGDWSTNLSSVNNSNVRGTVKAQSVGVGTGVNISISNSTSGAQHLWHVHTGACGTNGGIVGSMSNYPVLSVNSSGEGSANATIPTALNEQAQYQVNVHRSASDLTVIACGNLNN